MEEGGREGGSKKERKGRRNEGREGGRKSVKEGGRKREGITNLIFNCPFWVFAISEIYNVRE